jgi:hypothetical protein
MKTCICICILFSGILLLNGCAPKQIEETLYLGDAKIKAPITTPPLHLNIKSNPGEVTFSPKLSVTNSRNMLATSDEAFTGTATLPDGSVYRTRTQNIEWVYNRYLFGLDMDLKVSRRFAFFGGLSFSNENYLGGNIGIGFFSYLTEPIVRFDLGLTFQECKYDAITIFDRVIQDWSGNVTKNRYLYHDVGEETNFNPFFTITFNSNNDSALVNYFVNAGYFIQQLLDYSPGTTRYEDPFFNTTTTTTDKRPDCSAGFIYINPGISLSIAPDIRILISAKLLKETILQLDSGSIIIMPNVQFDFQL